VHIVSLAEDTYYAVLDVAGDGGDKQTLAEVFDWAGHVDHVLVTAGGISGTGPPLTGLSADDIRTTVGFRLQAPVVAARAPAPEVPTVPLCATIKSFY
jgi:NAD(P)-dependent dehydrogenase (short-subunit alcohol dehydrogenase family)